MQRRLARSDLVPEVLRIEAVEPALGRFPLRIVTLHKNLRCCTGLLLAKERLNISAAAHDVKNHYVLVFDAIDDDVFAHGKTSQAGA